MDDWSRKTCWAAKESEQNILEAYKKINNELTNFQKVGIFQKTFNSPVYNPKKPAKMLPKKRLALRKELIREEYEEVMEAIDSGDLVHIAKELSDLLYVAYGIGHELNIDLDACLNEVQRSNLSKLDENGQVIYREEGKVLKSSLYSPADLSFVLKAKNG